MPTVKDLKNLAKERGLLTLLERPIPAPSLKQEKVNQR